MIALENPQLLLSENGMVCYVLTTSSRDMELESCKKKLKNAQSAKNRILKNFGAQ